MKINREQIVYDLKHNLIIIVAVVVFMALLDFLFGTTCPFRFLFGIPCPGCGITRAFLLVARGELAEATRMHAFWIPVVLLVAYWGVCRYLVKPSPTRDKMVRILMTAMIVVAVLMLAYYAYRMVTVFPNAEPMLDDHMWCRHFPR